MKEEDGGQTKVEIGIKSGILFIDIKSWASISWRFIRADGSVFKIPRIKSFA